MIKRFLCILTLCFLIIMSVSACSSDSTGKSSSGNSDAADAEVSIMLSDEEETTKNKTSESDTHKKKTKKKTKKENTKKSETKKEKKPVNETSTEPEQTKIEAATEDAEPEKTISENSYFRVYYIDVEQGDASLIVCDDEAMLIDGGEPGKSDLIYAFLKNHNINHLKYIICTHADEDHVGGLAGALNYATADTAYCSETYHDSRAFQSFLKYLGERKLSLQVPATGTEIELGSASGKIIGPVRDAAGTNDNSIVIRMQYGETSFLFPGDAEDEEESDLIYSGTELNSTVLKVAHHGNSFSTSDRFLEKVNPQYSVISCGAGNMYGHPADDTLERLKQTGTALFRTDLQGDIICESDGKEVHFRTEKNDSADTWQTYDSLYGQTENTDSLRMSGAGAAAVENASADEAEGGAGGKAADYILNKNTGKFHHPSCNSVKQMKEQNKVYFTGTRDEAIAQGYVPCKNCNP